MAEGCLLSDKITLHFCGDMAWIFVDLGGKGAYMQQHLLYSLQATCLTLLEVIAFYCHENEYKFC